jgi:hypothetical protein
VLLGAARLLAEQHRAEFRMILPNDSLAAQARAALGGSPFPPPGAAAASHPPVCCPSAHAAVDYASQGGGGSRAPQEFPALEVRVGGVHESLARADLALASTGTVTLECALFGVPTLALYRTSWITYQLGKRLAAVEHLAMPNILARQQVFPEFIQGAATSLNLARAAGDLLADPARRAAMRQDAARTIGFLGEPGASARAAQAVVRLLQARP